MPLVTLFAPSDSAKLEDDPARFLRVLGVMHVAAAFATLPLIGFEVEVEMGERVVLDVAGAVAQGLELRQPLGGFGAPDGEVARMDERALQTRVGQRVVGVLLELRRGRDRAHRSRPFWASPIAGPSAMPARTSATWRALTGDPSRWSLPAMFIRQPRSPASTVSAARVSNVLALARNDGVGEFAVLGREHAAEAAAGLGLLEFDEAETLDARKQSPRLAS